MCKTCLRSGWRGIWDKGRKLLKALQAQSCWVTTERSDGTQQVQHRLTAPHTHAHTHTPLQVHGPQLRHRLKRLWDFLRLQHRRHFGQTHNERRTHKRKSKSDNEQQPKCRRLTNTTMPAGRNLTATETCTGINLQAHALYSLAARGEGATFAERDEYNLLKYKHSDLTAWGSRYDWKPGCNVSHLPVTITSVRNVDDWICVNVFADGTVVFKRLSPPLYCRGSRAAPRRTKFVWTPVMSQWFANRTHGLHKKSIQFVEMSEEAHDRWGHLAPDQEHMENRIKSRDQARKEGRRVAWDTPKPGVSVRL